MSSTNKISKSRCDIALLYWMGWERKILISSGPLFISQDLEAKTAAGAPPHKIVSMVYCLKTRRPINFSSFSFNSYQKSRLSRFTITIFGQKRSRNPKIIAYCYTEYNDFWKWTDSKWCRWQVFLSFFSVFVFLCNSSTKPASGNEYKRNVFTSCCFHKVNINN